MDAEQKENQPQQDQPQNESAQQQPEQSQAASKQEQAQPEQALTSEAKNMAMLCHILGLVGILGPLIAWIIVKDKHPFVDSEGKEAINFQISMLIYWFIAGLLTVVAIGVILMPVLLLLNLIFVILAAVSASGGKPYRYPIAIRFIK